MVVKAVPEGFHSVTPYLVVKGASDAVEFYKRAFGAVEKYRHYSPNGNSIVSAVLKIGNSVIMLSDESINGEKIGCRSPKSIGGSAFMLHIYTNDVDRAFDQAVSAGAAVMMPVMDAFWGDRYGQLVDPFGHFWSIATHKQNLTYDQIEKAGEVALKEMITSKETQNSASQNITYPYIPKTVSKEAREELQKITFSSAKSKVPDPNDLNEWKKQYYDSESFYVQLSKPIMDLYQSNIIETKVDGVQVVDIKPKIWNNNGKVLVYAHGGGYAFGSANSTLGSPILVANATGLRILSIDYTVAPFSKWNQITDEIIAVTQALKDQQGYSLDDITMYGDSAGGGLVTGSILKMRDKGLGMPAALVLWSPWLDLTGNGDTYFTLKDVDPYLSYDSFLRNVADAYADPADQNNPYVSPAYGNFSQGYTPTLIQGGTREIILSDFIRFYQALDQAGIPVKLDLYEGMPHVFQTFFHNTTESNIAVSKTNEFLKEYLNY